MAGQEPVRRPLAEPTQCSQRRLHLVVGKRTQPVEVDVGTCDSDHVLGLAAGEAEGGQLLLAGTRHPLARRERVGVHAAHSEPLDHPVSDREGGEQRHLLRRDRADDRLVWIGRERRSQAGESLHQRAEYLVLLRPSVERAEVEVGPHHRPRDRLDLGAERRNVDAARRGFDPKLAPGDDAVDAALVPEVREIGPERSEALGRDLEVVRLRERKRRQASERATSRRSSNGSNVTPRAARYRARPSRAKMRSAAWAAQRSE